jgi:peptidoglycan/LPS O-acetylase OafA/YrhL
MRARLDAAVGRTTSLGFAPIVLALPVASALYGYAAWIPWGGIPTPDYALVPNLPAFLAYGTAFAFGWLLHRQPDLLAHFRSAWASYLGAALVLTAHCLWQVGLDGLTETPLPTASQRAAYAASYGLGSWCWTFALTGAALRFLADERPTIRYLADASYWLYLLHLPLVFALQALAMHWPLHWSVKFPLVVVAATAILLVSYHGLVRFTVIGAVLNGRRFPRPGTASRATPATAAADDAVGTPRPR